MPSSKTFEIVCSLKSLRMANKPWQRFHVDFTGLFMGKSYLLILDAHSKWPQIIKMNTTTSERIIAILKRLFAQFGLPEQVVSDNGPQFTFEDLELLMQSNSFKHLWSTPYHPASNGAVEQLVRSFKEFMKAGRHDKLSPCHRLQNFHLNQPIWTIILLHATTCTRESPASLLDRQIWTRFDLPPPLAPPPPPPPILKRESPTSKLHRNCVMINAHMCVSSVQVTECWWKTNQTGFKVQ